MLVGCGVMPHAPMLLRPKDEQIEHLREVQEAHEACCALADQIRNRRPHVIVLVTPHGTTVEHGVTGVYMNSWARGSAEWSGGFSDVQVQCELDVLASRGLLKNLRGGGCRARGVEFFGGGRTPAPLGWSEVVPLWFLDDILSSSRFVVVSQGVCEGFSFGEQHCLTRAEAQSVLSSVADMMKVGQTLSDWADSSENENRRIFVLVSALLSHAHGGHGGRLNRNRRELDDGSLAPEQLLSPRYLSERTLDMRSRDGHQHDAAAQLYDQAIDFWLRTLRGEGLLVTARKAVPLAQPCGYGVLVILNGVLDGRDHSIWDRQLLVRSAPTNFGLCVSSLLPRWDRLPTDAMDTSRGHILLDLGEEFQLITIKCWFNDFGDFLDIHGEVVVMPEQPRTPTPSASGSRPEVGSQSRPSTGRDAIAAEEGGIAGDVRGDEDEDADASGDEDLWDSMLGEENKKNREQEEHIAWLAEQERLKGIPERTPTPPPTKAEKQMAMVQDEIEGRILVVFAETLKHLHEQCVLAVRYGACGVRGKTWGMRCSR